MKVDYERIGLLVGLECHQQLDTREKLFCSCGTGLFRGDPEVLFMRRLRPTQSELGQVDPAAFFEFQKGVKIIYEANNETSCLVEMDEEPPHRLNGEALEIALTVALMMNAKPVDEVHVMRKIVIDGSNTTGFQRTCVVALNGMIEVDGKEIPIQHISLEEDAARKVREDGSSIYYRIDRLGIPLIEVATAPVITSPSEAERVAFEIGQIFRATGKVKRGIGTIRQDLNISIRDGALMEIKGVQELNLISKVVEYEVQRQLSLLRIKEELGRRGVKREEISGQRIVDVTSIFKGTECKVLRRAIRRDGRVLSVKLPGFAGLLGVEVEPGVTFGREIADRARFWGRVGGIFHTDELPAYGITEDEVRRLRDSVGADDGDCVVFVADEAGRASDALRAVLQRAAEALDGVPEETRAANPDGTTRYMRPRPGAARMYPETDVPPVMIDEDYIGRIRRALPLHPRVRRERLIRNYRLNEKLASQLLNSEYLDLFESIAGRGSASPTLIAATLTETFKALMRDGVDVRRVPDNQIVRMFDLVGSGDLAKEAIPQVISWLSTHEGSSVDDAVKSLGLAMISREDLERIIDGLVAENRDVIVERGERAFGPLMGMIMRRLRGRVKADLASRILKEKITEVLGGGKS